MEDEPTYIKRLIHNKMIRLFHGRCHEPELHMSIHGESVLFNKLPTYKQKQLTAVCLDVWTHYDPVELSVNCGQNAGDYINFKFYFEADHHFPRLLNDLMIRERYASDGERANGSLDVLRSQRDHYNETHKSFARSRQRKTLLYYQKDINVLNDFLQNRLKAELPSFDELSKFGSVRLDPKIHFQHENGLDSGCSTLSIHIETKDEEKKEGGESFSIINYNEEIFQAIKCLTEFMDQSTAAVAKYIHSVDADYKIQESDQWFDLRIGVEERNGKKMIAVSCKVSMMHYVFMMLYKFEEDAARKWMNDYMLLIERELRENHAVKYRCGHREHYLLFFCLDERKLKGFTVLEGGKNHMFDVKKEASEYWRNFEKNLVEKRIGRPRKFDDFSEPKHGYPRYNNNGKRESTAYRIRKRRELGEIGRWNEEGGFGFIKLDGHNRSTLFVHISELPPACYLGAQRVRIGTKLEFDIVNDEKGQKAVNVSLFAGENRVQRHNFSSNIRSSCQRNAIGRGHRFSAYINRRNKPEIGRQQLDSANHGRMNSSGRFSLRPPPKSINSRFANMYI